VVEKLPPNAAAYWGYRDVDDLRQASEEELVLQVKAPTAEALVGGTAQNVLRDCRKPIAEGRSMQESKRLFFILMMLAGWATAPALAGDSLRAAIPQIPTLGLVTMVDLGATKCIPCKMMAPIIEELQKEYAGRASIVFIDVWEHNEQVKRFGIRAIPTQIFYDKAGKEVSRHVGFMDKKSIVATFEKLGVPKKGEQ
jgi:thioredoxin 1